MTNEEIIADERYHTCGRCKWEDIPFICHQCKWGEDVRKDLWQLKEESEVCFKCIQEAYKQGYSDGIKYGVEHTEME